MKTEFPRSLVTVPTLDPQHTSPKQGSGHSQPFMSPWYSSPPGHWGHGHAATPWRPSPQGNSAGGPQPPGNRSTLSPRSGSRGASACQHVASHCLFLWPLTVQLHREPPASLLSLMSLRAGFSPSPAPGGVSRSPRTCCLSFSAPEHLPNLTFEHPAPL